MITNPKLYHPKNKIDNACAVHRMKDGIAQLFYDGVWRLCIIGCSPYKRTYPDITWVSYNSTWAEPEEE